MINKAHDYALQQVANTNAVRTVHIAPASVITKGDHTLTDKDLVINRLLRISGKVQPSNVRIPGYKKRPANADGNKDYMGHGLLEIYLNDNIPKIKNIKVADAVNNNISHALKSLSGEYLPKQIRSGFLTVTLTWNGTGDADLHVYEPDGSHVYFADMQGKNGALDIDNITGLGPEHYVIPCDANNLSLGTYRVKIANFTGAEGRTATISLNSYFDGNISTKTIKLGAETLFNDPAHHAFSINIAQTDNNYSVKLLKTIH